MEFVEHRKRDASPTCSLAEKRQRIATTNTNTNAKCHTNIDEFSVDDVLSVPLEFLFREVRSSVVTQQHQQQQQRRKALLTRAEAQYLLRTSQLAHEVDVLVKVASQALEKQLSCRLLRSNIEWKHQNHPILRSILPLVACMETHIPPVAMDHVQHELDRVLYELELCATSLRQFAEQNWTLSESLLDAFGASDVVDSSCVDGSDSGGGMWRADANGVGHELAKEKRMLGEVQEEVVNRIERLLEMATTTTNNNRTTVTTTVNNDNKTNVPKEIAHAESSSPVNQRPHEPSPATPMPSAGGGAFQFDQPDGQPFPSMRQFCSRLVGKKERTEEGPYDSRISNSKNDTNSSNSKNDTNSSNSNNTTSNNSNSSSSTSKHNLAAQQQEMAQSKDSIETKKSVAMQSFASKLEPFSPPLEQADNKENVIDTCSNSKPNESSSSSAQSDYVIIGKSKLFAGSQTSPTARSGRGSGNSTNVTPSNAIANDSNVQQQQLQQHQQQHQQQHLVTQQERFIRTHKTNDDYDDISFLGASMNTPGPSLTAARYNSQGTTATCTRTTTPRFIATAANDAIIQTPQPSSTPMVARGSDSQASMQTAAAKDIPGFITAVEALQSTSTSGSLTGGYRNEDEVHSSFQETNKDTPSNTQVNAAEALTVLASGNGKESNNEY